MKILKGQGKVDWFPKYFLNRNCQGLQFPGYLKIANTDTVVSVVSTIRKGIVNITYLRGKNEVKLIMKNGIKNSLSMAVLLPTPRKFHTFVLERVLSLLYGAGHFLLSHSGLLSHCSNAVAIAKNLKFCHQAHGCLLMAAPRWPELWVKDSDALLKPPALNMPVFSTLNVA